jgi:hypothetical protein
MRSTERITPSTLGDELGGYRVDGKDGLIGKVERVTYDKRCLVVRGRCSLARAM